MKGMYEGEIVWRKMMMIWRNGGEKGRKKRTMSGEGRIRSSVRSRSHTVGIGEPKKKKKKKKKSCRTLCVGINNTVVTKKKKKKKNERAPVQSIVWLFWIFGPGWWGWIFIKYFFIKEKY